MNEKPNRKLIAAFEDVITEESLIRKLGWSKSYLQKLRRDGSIKCVHSLSGKGLIYSKTEIANLLQLTNKPDEKLQKAFKDLVGEDEVRKSLGYSREYLANLRRNGTLKWFTITGRNIVYSKSDIAKQLNVHCWE
jgi:predicted site-specific integrase-resolvase